MQGGSDILVLTDIPTEGLHLHAERLSALDAHMRASRRVEAGHGAIARWIGDGPFGNGSITTSLASQTETMHQIEGMRCLHRLGRSIYGRVDDLTARPPEQDEALEDFMRQAAEGWGTWLSRAQPFHAATTHPAFSKAEALALRYAAVRQLLDGSEGALGLSILVHPDGRAPDVKTYRRGSSGHMSNVTLVALPDDAISRGASFLFANHAPRAVYVTEAQGGPRSGLAFKPFPIVTPMIEAADAVEVLRTLADPAFEGLEFDSREAHA